MRLTESLPRAGWTLLPPEDVALFGLDPLWVWSGLWVSWLGYGLCIGAKPVRLVEPDPRFDRDGSDWKRPCA